MTGSYLFNYESYYNGLMTDWGSITPISFQGCGSFCLASLFACRYQQVSA